MENPRKRKGPSAPANVLQLLGTEAEEGVSRQSVEVNVIRIRQKDVPMYFGKMTARDLLRLYDIDAFKEEELVGYQRELYRERTTEVFEYLVECPIAVMPGVFVSLRQGGSFKPQSKDGDLGVLEIPYRKGAVWMIDGQHRLGGFEKALRGEGELVGVETTDQETLSNLMQYELPVVFVDSFEAAQRVKPYLKNPDANLDPIDIERVIFTVVNKTAKSINPSLKDSLLYKIHDAGIGGIPFIGKEEWRATATKIAIELHKGGKFSSPLIGKINIGGQKGLKRPVRLNSFVSSLERLIRDNSSFKNLGGNEGYTPEKFNYVLAYWNALSEICKEGFQYERDYMVLKTIGVYSLNRLASDVFDWLQGEGLTPSKENIIKFIAPLKTYKWSKEDSPLAAYGGLKGVREAYKRLLEHLASNGISKASDTLEEIRKKEEERAKKAKP